MTDAGCQAITVELSPTSRRDIGAMECRTDLAFSSHGTIGMEAPFA